MSAQPAHRGAPDPAVIEYARGSLIAAVSGEWQAAADLLAEMQVKHGDESILTVMQAWIDTACARLGLRKGGTEVFAPAWRNAETGQVTTADDTPPEARWAGRLISARANDDRVGYYALLNAIPRDRRIVGDHVMALLQAVAFAVNGTTGTRRNS